MCDVWMCSGMFVHIWNMGTGQMSLFITLYPSFWDRISHWIWNVQIGWLADQDAPGIPLPLPSQHKDCPFALSAGVLLGFWESELKSSRLHGVLLGVSIAVIKHHDWLASPEGLEKSCHHKNWLACADNYGTDHCRHCFVCPCHCNCTHLALGSQCCQPTPATRGLNEIHYI